MPIQPYTPTTRIAHEIPGIEHFDSRSHFILHPRITHVAVSIQAHNLDHTPLRSRSARDASHINIRDTFTGIIVTSKTLHIRIDADDEYITLRNDLPPTSDMICPYHIYKVEAYHPGTENIVLERQLAFFNADTRHDQYYSPVNAYLCYDNDSSHLRYTDIDVSELIPFTLTFTLHRKQPLHVPETLPSMIFV